MKSMRGFTLVEVLIATALGLVVLAGTLTAWMHAQRSYARAQVENRLHERAQYVFATLEPELQMAGFLGIGATVPAPDPADLAPSARSCGDALVTDLGRALEFSDNRYDLACPAQGRGAVPGSDVLTLRRASSRLSSPDPGRAQLLGTLWPPSARTLIWDGALPPGATLQPSRTELRDLIVRSYYIARSSDGDAATPALRVKSLTAISGRPAFVDTEVMAGIEDLQVTVSPSTGVPRSVQVLLSVRADAADARSGEPLARRRVSRHFALRNVP
jgi:prepilin-type N-terminal cleavage/methylation domain-containing protein